MTGVLGHPLWLEMFRDDLLRAGREAGIEVSPVAAPLEPGAKLDPAVATTIEYVAAAGPPPDRGRLLDVCFDAPNLRWVHARSAGLDRPQYGVLMARGVRITNSTGVSAEPIAQHALTGMLMLARNFHHYLDAQRRRAWEPLTGGSEPPELRAQTALVYGLGAIGCAFARMAKAIGLHVIGVRRSGQRPDDPVDEVHPPSALDSLLPRTDWLVITAPLSAETRGLFNAERLALLPRGAHVLNVGRGPIIVQDDLIAALRSGQVGGAYLDVFEREPLPADSPLWELPRVIVTPHNSSTDPGNDRRSAEIFFANMGRIVRGEPLINEMFEAGS